MERRVLRLAACTALLGMVACSAIAGLDGEFVDDFSGDGGGATSSGSTSGGLDGSPKVDGQISDGQAPLSDAGLDVNEPRADAEAGPNICSPLSPDAAAASTSSPTLETCPNPTPGRLFCWNFNGTNDPPAYGWNDAATTAGGNTGVEGVSGDPARKLHISLNANQDGLARGLIRTDWDTNKDGGQDLSFPANKTIEIGMSFQIDQPVPGIIMSASYGTERFGLELYTDPCDAGQPRFGMTGFLPRDLPGGAFYSNEWHRLLISIRHETGETWPGSIKLDGTVIGSKAAFSAGAKNSFELSIGLFDMGKGPAAELRIDDITIFIKD